MDGKVGLFTHTHTHLSTHTGDAAAGLDPEHQVQAKSDKSWGASKRVAQQNFPEKPTVGRISKCVLQMYEYTLYSAYHYLSLPVSALTFLRWGEFINQIQHFEASLC